MAPRADGESPKAYEKRMAQAEAFDAWKRLMGDSRCREQVLVPSPIGLVVRLYCLNCGRPGGAVRADPQRGEALYICRECAATHGGLTLPEIPREAFVDNPEEG